MYGLAFIFILAGVIWVILVFYLLIYLSLPFGFIEACFLIIPTVFLFLSAANSTEDDETTPELIATDTNIEIALLAVLLGGTELGIGSGDNFVILVILSLILSLFVLIPIRVGRCYQSYVSAIKSIFQVFSLSLLIYGTILLLQSIIAKRISFTSGSASNSKVATSLVLL
ncbi:Transmembrane domain-containing protein [Orpheovirus IHUMI-LCC2]|uniref:Transmembrane domain-containing protein n=1 Tax=Orpheovirus IHUMI-LCC2 TaxID=2023057 RepID=A0A2I2L5A4_9VIRU|nr:Transmembrane domain-containing protein [Orpheovirus IHUMI-LCC2]SNW62707.1 Transmembrane domain-containing protein [Orpheovirus IHUMI-LCC2]